MTPDYCAGKTAAEIANMPVYMDGQTFLLGTFFTISGKGGTTSNDTKLIINGDLRKIRYIGMGMSDGEIVINGSCGMYTGAWMTGGTINVNGNIDSFAAIGMKGGHLIVNGDAQDYLGASYRGDLRGVQGGVISVKGAVGSDIVRSTNYNSTSFTKNNEKSAHHGMMKLTYAQKAELAEMFSDKGSISLANVNDTIKDHFGIDMKKMQVSRLVHELQRI